MAPDATEPALYSGIYFWTTSAFPLKRATLKICIDFCRFSPNRNKNIVYTISCRLLSSLGTFLCSTRRRRLTRLRRLYVCKNRSLLRVLYRHTLPLLISWSRLETNFDKNAPRTRLKWLCLAACLFTCNKCVVPAYIFVILYINIFNFNEPTSVELHYICSWR